MVKPVIGVPGIGLRFPASLINFIFPRSTILLMWVGGGGSARAGQGLNPPPPGVPEVPTGIPVQAFMPPPPPPEPANPDWLRCVHLDAPGQGHGQQSVSGTADPGVVQQDKSSRGSVDTTRTRSDPQSESAVARGQ